MLAAFSDPTRRAILERLGSHEQAVGEVASGLPVSRPAVSQHLRVLENAGLVACRREGTRRIYRVEEAGLLRLQAYLHRHWGSVLGSFGAAARRRGGGRE